MTVFKMYMAVIRKNLPNMLMYLALFLFIGLLVVHYAPRTEEAGFTAQKTTILVADKDNSALSRGIVDYLSRKDEVKPTDGSKSSLVRALYYREAEYILTIPAGYEKGFPKGQTSLRTTKVPGSTAGYHQDASLEQYLRRVRGFLAADCTMKEAVAKARKVSTAKAPKVTMLKGTREEKELPSYYYTFKYFPYLYLSVIIYCVAMVLQTFRSREVQDRLDASPVPQRTRTLSAVSAFGLTFLGFWLFTLLLPLLTGDKAFYTAPLAWVYVVNAALLMIFSVALSFLLGLLVRSDAAISAVNNIVGLGFCFLCGVFVPMEIMSESVLKVSRFLPVYWYSYINDLVGMKTTLSSGDWTIIRQGWLIQLAAAVALVFAALFVGRQKARKE